MPSSSSRHDRAPVALVAPGRPSRRRRAGPLGALAIAAALVLAACGSSSGGNTGNTGAAAGSTSTTGSTNTTVPSMSALTSELTSLQGEAPSGKVSLTEDGSSLFYPLYQAWVTGYMKVSSNFSSTSGADGSGTGISDAASGTIDLGASDAYLPPATASQSPNLINIPVVISSQMVNYNVPGVPASTHLKLNGKVLTGMYDGSITNWDSSEIKSLNPGVTLPNLKIVPIHRSDSSGDSFLFTSYLALADTSSFAAHQGPSTTPTFPSVSGAQGAVKNSGMVSACGATKGCVAYIGISYKTDTNNAGLGYAALQNKQGKYLVPTPTTIKAAVAGFPHIPANGSISLVYGPAEDGYPIVNFEYIIVKTNQSSSTKAAGIRAFLAWGMDPSKGSASSYLNPVGFQPLTASALSVAITLLKKVQ